MSAPPPGQHLQRLLILGGTTEARELAAAVVARHGPRVDCLTSLAGRTRHPIALAGRVRSGGFGGVAGLTDFIAAEGVEFLIDATHPFASRMPHTAVEAAARAGIAHLRLERPVWLPDAEDNWHCVDDITQAVAHLRAHQPAHAFITVGAQEAAAFADIPGCRITLRLIEAANAPAERPDFKVLVARGPFDVASETRLLRDRGADILVTKNSGGTATAAKLQAAQALGLPVVMVARPKPRPAALTLSTPDAALAWLSARLAGPV